MASTKIYSPYRQWTGLLQEEIHTHRFPDAAGAWWVQKGQPLWTFGRFPTTHGQHCPAEGELFLKEKLEDISLFCGAIDTPDVSSGFQARVGSLIRTWQKRMWCMFPEITSGVTPANLFAVNMAADRFPTYRVSAEVECRIRSEDLAEGELTLLSDWLITEERFGNVTQSLLVNRTFSELELHYYDVAAASHPRAPLTFCAADDTCPTCPKMFAPDEGKSVQFMILVR